jgi:hypothetical protein
VSPEHFTKNTISANFWCNKCAKPTLHRVDDRRRGPCLACMAKLEAERQPAKEKLAEQIKMF